MINSLSVVIPAYRAEGLIGRTVKSILAEGVPPRNIIVVEDGVYDETRSVLKNYNVTHLIQENQGAPIARNYGLANVKTEYVMFIDSDDFVSDGLLHGLIESAISNKSDMVFGPWRYEGENIKKGRLRYPPDQSTREWVFFWLNKSMVPTCSVLWKTSSIRNISAWDPRLKKNQDGELAIRAFINGFSISRSHKGYSTYWQHSSINRVSNASIHERLKASELIYKSVVSWIGSDSSGTEHYSLGRFCHKEAWSCFSEGVDIEGNQWLQRARALGYKDVGYSAVTKLFGLFLGVKRGSKLKRVAFPIFKKIIYK